MKVLLNYERFYQYRGNIIESIGRIKDDRVVEVLVELLNSPDSVILKPTIIALGKLKNKKAVKPLIKIAAGNKTYLSSIVSALPGVGTSDTVEILIGSLPDEDPDIRGGALPLLGEFLKQKTK